MSVHAMMTDPGVHAVLASYGSIPTGIGTEARWLWRTLPFKTWVQTKHKKFSKSLGWGATVDADGPFALMGRRIVRNDWMGAVRRADVVVCIERPLPDTLPHLLERYDVPLIVLANPEWTHAESSWLPHASLVVARTDASFVHLEQLGLENVVRCEVPMDLSELPYTIRTRADKVRFSGGWGGVHERKGWPEVLRMLELRPGGIEVYSQRPVSEPHTGEVLHGRDLYHGADVMLVPSRYEGVGLTVLEGMASGCIVVATDADPMRQFLQAAYGQLSEFCLLPVERAEVVEVGGVPWPAHIIDPAAAWAVLDRLKESPQLAGLLSDMGREYIQRVHGPAAAVGLWTHILRTGATAIL